MKFVLLDDDIYFSGLFESTMKKASPETEIVTMNDEDKFVEFIRLNYSVISAIFMDIELEHTNGIELASCINHSYRNIPIVFVTGFPEKYCQDVFLRDADLIPYAFLVKPLSEEKCSKVIEKISVHKNVSRSIALKIGKRNVILNINDIVYIESSNKSAKFYTLNSEYQINKKLSEITEMLPDTFLMPHKSYLVNIKYISEFTNMNIQLENGHIIPISRNKKTSFIDRLIYLRGFGIDS